MPAPSANGEAASAGQVQLPAAPAEATGVNGLQGRPAAATPRTGSPRPDSASGDAHDPTPAAAGIPTAAPVESEVAVDPLLDAPTTELPRTPSPTTRAQVDEPSAGAGAHATGGGLRSLLTGAFRKKPPKKSPGQQVSPGADGRESMALAERTPRAEALTVVDDTPAPTRQRPRKAMKPLPWGRDFAAAVIHRDDGLTAIFGKLDAADSPRVALVAPRGSRELSKALGMRRLRRHVDMTGKDVMIVTHSGGLRSRAREVGLAVTGNVRGVDFERYGRSGLRVGGVLVPLPGFGLFLRLTLFLAAIAGIAAVVLLYLPEATVQVFPQIQTLETTANATVSSEFSTLNAAAGQVPGHRRSLTLTRTVDFPVHGQTTVKGPDGADQTVPAASDDDVKQANAFAQQVLLNEGRKTLEQRNKGETLIQKSAILSALDSKANVKAGDPADLLEITASGQVTMLSANNTSLRALLKQGLSPAPDSRQMYLPDTFTATTLSAGDYDKNNNRIQVRFKLTEGITRAFSVTQLRKAVAGKSKLDAQEAVIERVDQTQPAKIKLQPGWAPWLPRFTSRITIHLMPPPALASAGGAGAQPGATPAPSPTPAPQ
ncbi:MAG: hypothetical protein ACYDCQ_02320 [Dehalococcoidia bacterium]